eukprot:6138642-Ditylum_brightwellii.AAC.1
MAQYIVDHHTPQSRRKGLDHMWSWAKTTLQDLDRTVQRIAQLYNFYLDEIGRVRKVCCVFRAKKQNKKGPRTTVYKYGIEVPQNVKHAIKLDKANGNTMWRDAMALEVDALQEMECFDLQEAGDRPAGNYQCITLHMARLVAGGHLIDLLDNKAYSSTAKGISVKLLHVIAHCIGLNTLLCGNIGYAYVNACTTNKVYAVAGPKFGEALIRKIVMIRKALYKLATSCACFHKHLSDTLGAMDFLLTSFDRDVWIILLKSGKTYECICMHVDDF